MGFGGVGDVVGLDSVRGSFGSGGVGGRGSVGVEVVVVWKL